MTLTIGTRMAVVIGGDDVRVSVRLLGRDDTGRTVWEWIVRCGPIVSRGQDLRSGVNDTPDPRAMLESLCDFLEVHVESERYPGSDNASLFQHPPYVSDAVAEAIRSEIGWNVDGIDWDAYWTGSDGPVSSC